MNKYNNPHNSKLYALIILLAFYIIVPMPTGAASNQANGLLGSGGRTEARYKEAKDYYYRLERDKEFGADRNNWLTGVRKFRRLYILDSNSEYAPSSLYNMARMHYRMYERFKLPMDLDEAIVYYNDVATVFSRNSLADDALFTAAEIHLNDKKNPNQAAKLYAKLITRFPEGDKYVQAISRLHDLSKKYQIKLPKNLPNSASLQHLVNVLPVKYWSSDDYTRIVIRATEPVQYTASLLEKDEEQPRRIYIDFAQSYIPPRFVGPIPIEDGLLKQVRTGQFNQSTVRVVLDIESISDYKIFSLNDPFRVIIDVHGEKKAKQTQIAANNTPPPTASNDTQPVVAVERPESTPNVATNNTVQAPETETTPTVAIITLEDHKKIRPSALRTGQETGPKLSLAQQLGLGVKRIVIDPGHGGKDPGAMAFGLKEKDIVLQVAKATASILQKQHGYDVILTREDDTFLELEERTAIANTEKADLFLSIHVNAHHSKSVRGIETFYLNLATNTEAMRVAARENATSTHNISDLQDILANLMTNSKIQESSKLAEYIHNSIVAGLDIYQPKSLGVKQAPFYVLIGAEMPAVLAEISFITNPEESKLLQKQDYLRIIADNIAAGVAGYVDHQRTAALSF